MLRRSEDVEKQSRSISTQIISQSKLMKTSEFWRCLNLRNPILHHTKISADSLTHRPIFNLARLILYKFHENRVRFLESVVRRVMMSGEHWPEPRVLLKLMSDSVMRIKVDGHIYDFQYPPVLDGVEQLFSDASVEIIVDEEKYVLPELRRLCETKGVRENYMFLKKYHKVIVDNFCNTAVDLLTFVYDITPGPYNTAQIRGLRQFEVISNHVFYEVEENTETLGLLHNLRFSTNSIQPGLHYDPPLMILACEESEHLLETVFQFGLLRLLPEGAKEFLNTWILEVRTKLRKQLKNGRFEKKVVGEFSISGKKPFLIPLEDKRFEEVLNSNIGNALNTSEFTVHGGKWKKYAMQTIRRSEEPILESVDKFFAVSQKINPKSRAALSEFFSDSPDQQAILYHTIAQLLRFVIWFSVSTIRYLFYRKKDGFKYVGSDEARFTRCKALEAYEKNPLVRIPVLEDVPMFRFEGKEPSEVTEDECAPAEVTDEDVGIPEMWKKSYQLILEWNRQLLEQRNRIVARYKMVKAEK